MPNYGIYQREKKGNFENEIEENCSFYVYEKPFRSVEFLILDQLLKHQYWRRN